MLSEDRGEADPRLRDALAAGDRAEVLAALVDARVFAAVTATATSEEIGAHGLRQESTAEMAVVLLETADGSRALPVFTDLAALQRWRPGARPVALTGPQACAAALDERADAVILDPAGAAMTLTELLPLSQSFVPVTGALSARRGSAALAEPSGPPPVGLVGALRLALRPEPVVAARVLEGADGLVLGVCSRAPLSPVDLAALGQRLVQRLGPALPADGLDLVEVPRRGPGLRVLPRWRP